MKKKQSFLVVYISIFIIAIMFTGAGVYLIDNAYGQKLAIEKGRIAEAEITVQSGGANAILLHEFIDDYGKKRRLYEHTNMIDRELMHLNGTTAKIYVYGKYGAFLDAKPSYVFGAVIFVVGLLMLGSIIIFLVFKHANSRKQEPNNDSVNDEP